MRTFDGTRRNTLRIGLPLLIVATLAGGCTRTIMPQRTVRPIPESATRPLPVQPVARPVARPIIRERIVGRSVEGRPIEMVVFGDGRESVLIFGGIHGSEPTSAYVAKQLINLLRRRPSLYADRTIAVLPATNPDGLRRGSRHNARGVDLNRNFPARNWKRAGRSNRHGQGPSSEPETQAIVAAIEMIQPERIVSIHSIARGRHCNNFDGPAGDIAREMNFHNGYPVKPSMGYPTPGSFGSWAGIDLGIPSITLELPRDASGPAAWTENRDALITFIEARPGQVGQ